VSAVSILDCVGMGNSYAAPLIKKEVEVALKAGERRFLLNLAGVKRIEQAFVLGLNGVKLLVDRAEGGLMVYGLDRDARDTFKRYADSMVAGDTEQEAVEKLLPTGTFRGNVYYIAVLGTDTFTPVAFQGVNHYQERGIFQYIDQPLDHLKDLDAVHPLRLVVMHANLGPASLRLLRRHLADPHHVDGPPFFFILGTPPDTGAMSAAVANDGFDDGLMMQFDGRERTISNLEAKKFRAILAKKLEALDEGYYAEQRRYKAKFPRIG
ncbi:MAG: hypothetical protein ABI743_14210, partial [bacterium]